MGFNAPDLPYQRAREDFECIWLKNTIGMEIIRDDNPQGGDYFFEDEDVDEVVPNPTVQMNIQGTSAGAYRRAVQGVVSDAEFGIIIAIDEMRTNFQFIVKWDEDPYDDSGYSHNDLILIIPSSYLDFEERIRERLR